MLKNVNKILPGMTIAIAIAFVAQFIEGLLPIHLIGGSVIALFIGMILNAMFNTSVLKDGLKFTSKKILKFAIILLGASLNIQTILTVGSMSVAVMVFTLLTCFGGGYFIGKALGLDWKISNLISAGTGICGGSAIAAIAPVIDAEDRDIAYAMSATFIFDMLMILAFPFMGQFLGLSDMAYGLWAGTAVNDTSSVVAAGYAYSEAAGDFATMVKLTRTLTIIPVVLAFAYINIRVKTKERVQCKAALDAVNEKATKYEVSQTDKIHEFSEMEEARGVTETAKTAKTASVASANEAAYGANKTAETASVANANEATAVAHTSTATEEPQAPATTENARGKVKILDLFPWFIVGFIGLAVVNSFGVIPVEASAAAKTLSKFLMVAALAAIGLNTNIKDMKKSGVAPMVHGFAISALVVIVAISVEWCMGLV